MQIADARATQPCRPNVKAIGCLQCTHLSLLSRQIKNSLAIIVWKPWVTDRRWKIQGDVRHEVLPKITVPTRVTQYAFIAPQTESFTPTTVSNNFVNSRPTIFRFQPQWVLATTLTHDLSCLPVDVALVWHGQLTGRLNSFSVGQWARPDNRESL